MLVTVQYKVKDFSQALQVLDTNENVWIVYVEIDATKREASESNNTDLDDLEAGR